MTNEEAIWDLRTGKCHILAIKHAIMSIELKDKWDKDIGMFCPKCRNSIHKHIYGINKKQEICETQVVYCPYCAEKLDWGEEE